MPFDDGGSIHLAFVGHARTPLGVGLEALAAAIEVQFARDVGPAWGLPAVKVTVEAAIPRDAWGLVFLDDADQAGALGYHDLTADGRPIGKVFVRTTLDDGQAVSVTASHEAIEQAIDPAINAAAQGNDGCFYALEACDAVEDQTYEIDGIAVSDFVHPAWFEPFRTHQQGVRFNHLDTLTQPFQLAPGGYIGVFRRGRWSQVFGSRAAEARFNPARKRRAVRRGFAVPDRCGP